MNSLNILKSAFLKYGIKESKYLEYSIKRIELINQLSLAECSDNKLNVLDIGGHWLYNSIMYAKDGHNVYAADIYDQIEPHNQILSKIANDFNIKLLNYNNLEEPVELLNLDDLTFDLVLFSEIIEHITFNPVKFWNIIHKILKPKGRIIITTPNFYYLPNLVRNFFSVLTGSGIAPTVDHILNINTYGHHWKLYTKKEIENYFLKLSPDFQIGKSCYFNGTPSKRRYTGIIKTICSFISFFKEHIYVEVILNSKSNGIDIAPHW